MKLRQKDGKSAEDGGEIIHNVIIRADSWPLSENIQENGKANCQKNAS